MLVVDQSSGGDVAGLFERFELPGQVFLEQVARFVHEGVVVVIVQLDHARQAGEMVLEQARSPSRTLFTWRRPYSPEMIAWIRISSILEVRTYNCCNKSHGKEGRHDRWTLLHQLFNGRCT
jgi:hypothetical protein